jgi:hypothetical protein
MESTMKTTLSVAIVFCLASNLAFAQTKPITTTPMVVNSAGKVIGRYVVGADGYPMVLMNAGRQVAALRLREQQSPGLTWGGGGELWYATTNCTGKAYLPSYLTGITKIRATIVTDAAGSNQRAYAEAGISETLIQQSSFNNGQCFSGFAEGRTGSPAVEIPLDKPPFFVQ